MYKSQMISFLMTMKVYERETFHEGQDQQPFHLDLLSLSVVGEALSLENDKANDAVRHDESFAVSASELEPYYTVDLLFS